MAAFGALPDIMEVIKHPEFYIEGYPKREFYRGVVEDINDPDKRGRIKVRVESLQHKEGDASRQVPVPEGKQVGVPTKLIDWAEPIVHTCSNKCGVVWVPEVGDAVVVAYEFGNLSFPIVFGGWFANKELPDAASGDNDTVRDARGQDKGVATALGKTIIDEPDDPYNATYPKNRVVKTPGGHLIELDDSEGNERINITHGTNKSWIEIHPDGTLVIGALGGRYTLVEGDHGEHVKGEQHSVIDGDASQASGDFTRECTDYEMEAFPGSVNMLAGNEMNLEASGNATFKATLLVLGPGTAPGDIVTTVTYPFDYITGFPIFGVTTVQAG